MAAGLHALGAGPNRKGSGEGTAVAQALQTLSGADTVLRGLHCLGMADVSLFRARARGADTWYATGTESRDPNTAAEGNPNSGTWQPVWDAWQRFIEPLVSQARAARPSGARRRGSACVARVGLGP